jgi:hypothetical protein
MTTKITPLDAIARLRDEGLEPRRYSGRGMFGADCIGVDVESREDAGALKALFDLKPTTDSMGRGVVAYWPALPWPEDA